MESCASPQRRLRRMARHVVGLEPHATAVTPQVLAIAEPWIVAGLGTALWAYAPQLMRLFRSLNPRDTLAGTTLTKEQLAAFADGLRTMPIGHAPGTIERSHQEPLETGDVLHPHSTPLIGLPAADRPLAMTKRLSFAKVLSDRLGADSAAAALAYDLVERIGHESPYAQTERLEQAVDNWVSDAAGSLDRDQFSAINGMCNKLHASHGVQLSVVTVSGALMQSAPREFATRLFNTWGVGDAKANTGVLIVLSGLSLGRGQKKIDIVTGDGLSHSTVLTDSMCSQIIQTQLLSNLRRGAFGKALVRGVKAIADTVDARSKLLPGEPWEAPTEPASAGFGGGKSTHGLGTVMNKPGGPLPPLILGVGALFGSQYVANCRCDKCGKFTVVKTGPTALPLESDWVDDAELALADLMDEDGCVPRAGASAAILEHSPKFPDSESSLVGTGMLGQLFMLEIPEPVEEFDSSEEAASLSRRAKRSKVSNAYAKELGDAKALRGRVDFTRLVMLLRQSVSAGCFTDAVAETTFVCSSCGHARVPEYALRENAGHDWDGGHAVAVPRDRNGNDGDRVRIYLLCSRSGVRRFHGFHARDDYRNSARVRQGGDDSALLMTYAMMSADTQFFGSRRGYRSMGERSAGTWTARDGGFGPDPGLWSTNGMFSWSESSGVSDSRFGGGGGVGGGLGGGGGGGGGGFGGGMSSGGGASASF